MTLKALGGLGTYIAGADAAVAAAGAVAAECGHNLLTGLVAVSRAAEEVNDDVKGEQYGIMKVEACSHCGMCHPEQHLITYGGK